MRIAFIDDGIRENTFAFSQQIEHYHVMPDLCVKKGLGTPGQSLSHGTLCAAIFNEIYSDNSTHILDIAILDNTGRAEISRLIAALEWCLRHSVKLIHMSLGTVNYHDLEKLKDTIDTLLYNQTILVSAFHNKYIRSYPAAFPGVFGVRRSKKGNCLKNGGFVLDHCEGLNIENSFVANFNKLLTTFEGIQVKTNYSNSLAAPVVTGHIAKYLNGNQTAGFINVLEYLKQNCSTMQGHSSKIVRYLNKGKHCIQIPVVVILWEDKNLFCEIKREFVNLKYSVAALTERDFLDAIPIFHYLNDNEKLNGGLLHTIEYIYDPDIILLCIESCRLDSIDWNIIDVLIKSQSSRLCMMTQGQTYQFESVKELFKSLNSYFEN